jgi:DNA repair photolyase
VEEADEDIQAEGGRDVKPIYEPKGKAKEYGDYALNIYTGCPHRCFYCFAPSVLRRDREKFHNDVRPRENIVEETRKQLEKEQITGKLIHLCFTCDPYPTGYDTTSTREIIALLKAYGNHVQILTKGDGTRDFDLLDENDWYGITLDGKTVISAGCPPIFQIRRAKEHGIKTWVSFEPVLDDVRVLWLIEAMAPMVNKVKIGKLNYHSSDIDWKKFGKDAESLCQKLGLDYYIKDSLRAEMNKP